MSYYNNNGDRGYNNNLFVTLTMMQATTMVAYYQACKILALLMKNMEKKKPTISWLIEHFVREHQS